MAIIACIIGAPISIFANALITQVLAVETSASIIAVHDSPNVTTRKVSFDESRRHSSTVGQKQRKSVTSSSVGLSTLSNSLSFLYANTDQLGTTFNEDLSSFMDQLGNYRNSQLANNLIVRKEFDEIWGIDSTIGHIRSDTDKLSWWDEMLGKEKDVHQLIVSDLNNVRTKAAKELEYLMQPQVSDSDRGKRLIRLFQQDLLPGLSGDIIESTANETVHASPSVPWWSKVLAWCILSGLNAGMLFYVYLFAMNESLVQQDAWFKSFVLWIVMDSLICATLTVYIKNMVIPSFAMSDLRKIRSKIVEAVKDGLLKMNLSEPSVALVEEGGTRQKPFNSADYFFVSARVATHFPELRESNIILHYVTTWPKRSYQHKSTVSSNYVSNTTAFYKSLGMIVSFILANFVACPPGLQNFCLQTSITTTVGYILVGATLLYKISILLLFAFVICILLIAHYVVKWNAGALKENLQIIDTINSSTNSLNKVSPIENKNATLSAALNFGAQQLEEGQGNNHASISLNDDDASRMFSPMYHDSDSSISYISVLFDEMNAEQIDPASNGSILTEEIVEIIANQSAYSGISTFSLPSYQSYHSNSFSSRRSSNISSNNCIRDQMIDCDLEANNSVDVSLREEIMSTQTYSL